MSLEGMQSSGIFSSFQKLVESFNESISSRFQKLGSDAISTRAFVVLHPLDGLVYLCSRRWWSIICVLERCSFRSVSSLRGDSAFVAIKQFAEERLPSSEDILFVGDKVSIFIITVSSYWSATLSMLVHILIKPPRFVSVPQ
ncbi:hypothetical protein ACFFRR_009577 [Megaselia abdita]